jgi:hypothetical protein
VSGEPENQQRKIRMNVLPARFSTPMRAMRRKCGAAKPLVKAHSRFGSWLVTPAMRISMGLEPAVLCHFPAGHSGKHSWQVRYNDPALRLNWGNLFPNPHILEIPPPAPKPKPPQVVKDADHYRALSLKYADGTVEHARKRTPRASDRRRAWRRRGR